MRERQYPDSELTHRTKIFLKDRLHLSDKAVGQQGNKFYLGYLGEEYVGIYHSKGGKRYFSLHLENPMNNVKGALEKNVMSDKAVFKRASIYRFKNIFNKINIESSQLVYKHETGEKAVPTVLLNTEIKYVPLGRKGRLSDNFLEYNFYYNIAPFIITVDNHKKGKF